MKTTIITLFVLFLFTCLSEAATRRFRATYRTDPSKSISIGWDQSSGTSPVMYYGTTDNGTNWNLYPFQAAPVTSNTDGGMNNTFVRLSGLLPNTIYYFVVKDSEGAGQRYSFQTISNDPSQPLSLICGADTRSGIDPRIIGFKLVAKLRPMAVIMNGDLTDSGTNTELQDWFDNWTYTIATDGRITPVVMAEGNHEFGIINLSNLFDMPFIGTDYVNNYYSIPFGGSLLRIYSLSSFVSGFSTETAWLKTQLMSYGNSTTWNLAQYHLPIRPVASIKPNNQDEYTNWVPLFEQYNVKLVQEADAHVFSMSWPIKSSSAAGNDLGFVRDDANGIIYFGEGGWGAPLYAADNPKSWIRGYGAFYHFMLVHFSTDKAEIYTVKFENEPNVPALTDQNRMNVPTQLSLEPLVDRNGTNSGNVVTLSRTATLIATNNYTDNITLFPTFVQHTLNVKFDNSPPDSNVKVFNLMGENMNTYPMPPTGLLQINMDTYSKGIYIIEIQNNNKRISSGKIIKQ